MATLTYTIPVAGLGVEQMIGAFATHNGWKPDSGITALEFSRLTLNRFVEDSISQYLALQAANAAREAALAQADGALGEVTTTLTIE